MSDNFEKEPDSSSDNNTDNSDPSVTEQSQEQSENDFELKIKELNDKYLRLLAENENLRKNHEQEKEDILKYGSFNFAVQILTLTDNLDRAFYMFKYDEKFKKDEFKDIIKGVELIEKDLQQALEKNFIKYIDCLNQKFDPKLHQSIGEKESDKEPGLVIEELQKGYMMHDRLLRPSMVYVSKAQKK